MRADQPNPLQGRTRKALEIALALLIVCVAAWAPRSRGLYLYVTTDEHLWLTRSAQFYYAILHGDYAATYQKEHPGVTIMWAGAAGFAQVAPRFRDRPVKELKADQFANYISLVDDTSFLKVLVAGRSYLVLANTIALALIFLYSRRLVGTASALLGCLLIALDPFHLALTRLLHLDGLLSSLMLLAMVSFLCFCQERRKPDLVVSGVVAGLAWLTKSPGFVLIPIVGLVAAWGSWRSASQADRQQPKLRRLWDFTWPLLVWGCAGATVFLAAFPAMWVQPIQTLGSILGMAGRYAQEGHDLAVFFNGKIIESGKMGLEYWYFYPITFLWRSTPLMLGGLPLAVWGFVKKRNPFDQPGGVLMAKGLLLLVVVFTLMMTLGSKKFDRYLVPIYPALDLLAGMGWIALANWLAERKKSPLLRFSPLLIAASVVAAQALLALNSFPYYLSYYNPLMGGGRAAPQVMQIGWGEGLDQAARYLKEKDHSRGLQVLSWYALGSVSYYFPGVVRYMGSGQGIDEHEWEKLENSDYAIVYINQWQRDLPAPILDYLKKKPVEHSVWINGIEYARIYKLP